MKLTKLYKSGGGGYAALVNGKEVMILKSYSENIWTAHTSDGSIDIEAETLSVLKHRLIQAGSSEAGVSSLVGKTPA